MRTAPRTTPARLLYVLYRFPQLSQTFVRDEIWALRGAGVDVDVLSLDSAGSDPPSDAWSGPYDEVARPGLRRALLDLAWWARRDPRALRRFFGFAAREPARRRYLLTRVPSAARRIAAAPPAHVHTHFAWDTATVASAIATLVGASSSITLHAKDIYAQPPASVRRRVARFDEIVTVCGYNVGFMDGSGITSVERSSVRVIPCGVARVEDDASNGARDDVVAVGRLVEKKGFDVLLRALSALPASIRPERAVIVGDGPQRAALEALSAELGLTDRVTFAGALPHEDTLAQIARARIFCLPCRPAADGDADAMPVVIREAMARGVPVIASRITGIPESLDDQVGWVVEPSSTESLAAALRAALADDEDRELRGRRARERARERWSFEGQASALANVFGIDPVTRG